MKSSRPGPAPTHGPKRRRLKAHSLIDKVYHWDNLYRAWRRVRRNKGAHGLDRVSIRHFEADLETHLREIQRKLMERRFQPQPVRRVYIPKASNPRKRRPLGIPVVADRVVGQALLQVLDPLFDGDLSPRSFGYRKGKRAHDAIATLLRDAQEGHRIVVDADLASFFDRLDHQVVMSHVRARIADGRVLDLIEAFLKAGIYEAGVVSVPTEGSPQGGVISPWLANLVLDDLDKALEAQGLRFVRYADDFVILCPSRDEADKALDLVREVLAGLKLSLNEEKTRISSMKQGFEFLGFEVKNYHLRARPRSIESFKDKVRLLTRRQQGRNVDMVLQDLNPVLRGHARYFGVAEVSQHFRTLDKWIRMRIRAFKTKRRCMNDNWRLPQRRLARWGLLSLCECRGERRISYVDAKT
jgi:group II intron reverse transcriptase/maturase